jgi:hypothetical protein
MVGICIFVIHQNSTIMKPVLIIDDARAVTLLCRLSEFVGAPVSSEFLSFTPVPMVQATLARILDLLSKSEDNETDRA